MEIKRGRGSGITVANTKALVPVIEQLFGGGEKFPIDLKSVNGDDLAAVKEALNYGESAGRSRGRIPRKTADSVQIIVDENDEEDKKSLVRQGTFTWAGPKTKDKDDGGHPINTVNVWVDRIGFKDETWKFFEPKICMYVVEAGKIKGVTVVSNVTPVHNGKYFVFDEQLQLAQALESIVPGSAIIFEFRHKKGNRISTKCWAFLEREELTKGTHALELYKKPVNLNRKNLSLFTVKPLYLHLDVDITLRPSNT